MTSLTATRWQTSSSSTLGQPLMMQQQQTAMAAVATTAATAASSRTLLCLLSPPTPGNTQSQGERKGLTCMSYFQEEHQQGSFIVYPRRTGYAVSCPLSMYVYLSPSFAHMLALSYPQVDPYQLPCPLVVTPPPPPGPFLPVHTCHRFCVFADREAQDSALYISWKVPSRPTSTPAEYIEVLKVCIYV